jgi:2-succinyl-6-hydroxy-2,4-cyclohexadiene-1-carboxylate synthase
MIRRNSSFSDGIYYKYFKNKKNPHTLLFLHGFIGNSSIWKEIIKELKEKYSILILDLVGHGKSYSPKKIEEYSFQNQSNKIIKTIEKLRINSLSIIAYSYSCGIGLLIANKLNKKTKFLIFISPYFKEKYNFLEKKIIKIMVFLWKYLLNDKRHELDYSKLEDYENPKAKDRKYILKSINTKDIIGSVYSFYNSEKKLQLINKNLPLFVIYGEKDKKFSKKTNNFFKKQNTKYVFIKGKKHLFLRSKSNEIVDNLLKFLAS